MPRGVYDRSRFKRRGPYKIKEVSSKPILSKELEPYVFEAPEFLKLASLRGQKSVAIAKMAEALRAIPSDKCLVFTITQLEGQIGKFTKFRAAAMAIKHGLRKLGIDRPKCVIDGDRLFITKSSLTN
jgi:hypothetical protein